MLCVENSQEKMKGEIVNLPYRPYLKHLFFWGGGEGGGGGRTPLNVAYLNYPTKTDVK